MDPIRQGLYSLLTGDTAVAALVSDRVYHQRAPRDSAFPYIIFGRNNDSTDWCLDGGDAGRTDREVWMVKAVDRGESSSTVEEIAEALDDALNDAPLTAIPGLLLLRRQGGIDYPEDDGADVYWHRGAMYRLLREHIPTSGS